MSTATVVAPAAAQPQAPTSRGFEVAMTPDPSRVAQARRIAKAHMRLWNITPAKADDVVLVVSELVTNAVEHGEGAIALRARYVHGDVHIGVSDESHVTAVLRPASDEDLGGRGLILVDALSKAWGTSPDGRTTWAILTVEAGEQPC